MFAAPWATIAYLLASSGWQPAAAEDYIVPTPTISVLNPSGIRFEIVEPNAAVSLIAYHYSINVDVPEREAGRWNFDVGRRDGKFVHENQLVRLNNGDTVHYWVYAIYRGLGYHLVNKQWTYSVKTPPFSRPSSATTSTASTTSLGAAGTPSTTVTPVSAGFTEGLSTRDAIILGAVLGVVVVMASALSVILVLRSKRNSRGPPSGNSIPSVGKAPEAFPTRPLSDDQSHVYSYVDEAYSRGSARRSPAESARPGAVPPLRPQALTGPLSGSRPPPPLPQSSTSATTPATDNYYIRLIT